MTQDAYFPELARKRKKLLIILMVTAGVLTLSVWGLIGIFKRTMQPESARDCQAILRNIGSSLKIYSGEHGVFPLDISVIKDWDTYETQCPNEPTKGSSGYVYLEGLAKNPPDDTILMFDEKENHTYGRNMMFTDGQVLWSTEQIFRFHIGRMLKEPYRELYPEKAIETLERINNEETEAGGKAIRRFSTAIMLLSLVTAMFWIFTFIVLLRFMQVAKYRQK